MKRPFTPKLLATVLEYSAEGKLRPFEGQDVINMAFTDKFTHQCWCEYFRLTMKAEKTKMPRKEFWIELDAITTKLRNYHEEYIKKNQ